MNIAAAVILFYPDTETIDNILSYSSFAKTLYAIDNSETPSLKIIESLREIPACRYFHDGENKGIAHRLNQVCKLAIAEGFEWLLTMDQDSSFSENNISTYITCLQKITDKEQIAVTGAEFIKRGNEGIGCAPIEVASVITSGSIINLSLFNKIGFFDEALFIDQVDHEYCYRAILNGYKVIKFTNVIFQHSLGTLSMHTSYKNLKSTNRSLHSPMRIYYMTRNYLYLKTRYKNSFPTELTLAKEDLFVRIKNNLLYNKKDFWC